MVELRETPTGFFVLRDGEPVHKSPIPEFAARWLAGDLENEPDMLEICEYDVGDVYERGLYFLPVLIPNASPQANALSVALRTLENGEIIRRSMH